ncbi:MAG: ester cyclase [Cyanobium sp.]
MKTPTNKEVVQAFFDVYNTKDYDNLTSCMCTNYCDHTLPQVRSIADAITILQSTHSAFPDMRVEILDLIEEDDRVVFRGRFSATHLGSFLGYSPTGKHVRFEAIEIFQLRDQKIIASWGYWPSEDIKRQIQAA